jgi:tetratricopeptide (TPR) repeat protein
MDVSIAADPAFHARIDPAPPRAIGGNQIQIFMPSCKYREPNHRFLPQALLLALALAASPVRAGDLETAQRQWLAGQRTQAAATLESALQRSPNELKLRFALGVLRMESGEPAAALAIFTALTQDFPDLADPYNNLAVLHASMGELDLAQQALEQALALQPGHAQAQENLGDVLLRLALRAYQRAQANQSVPSNSLGLKLTQTQALLQGLKLNAH